MSDSDRFIAQHIRQVEQAKQAKAERREADRLGILSALPDEEPEDPGLDDRDARESAIALLCHFAEAPHDSVSPALLAYMQSCVREWLGEDHDPAPRKAASSFNVERPTHRERSAQIREKHELALCRCLTSMDNGQDLEEAFASAAKAESVSMSAYSVKKLWEEHYDSSSPPEPSSLMWRAIARIRGRAKQRRIIEKLWGMQQP